MPFLTNLSSFPQSPHFPSSWLLLRRLPYFPFFFFVLFFPRRFVLLLCLVFLSARTSFSGFTTLRLSSRTSNVIEEVEGMTFFLPVFFLFRFLVSSYPIFLPQYLRRWSRRRVLVACAVFSTKSQMGNNLFSLAPHLPSQRKRRK